MQQRVSAVVFTLLALFLPSGLSLCLAQDRPVPASNQESTKPGATPVISDSSSPRHSEGCKLGAYTGTIPLNRLQYYAAGDEDLRGGMTCTFRISSKLPLFIF